jgi:hypothetical protein
MPRGGLRNPPGGRPKGAMSAPRRAMRAAAAQYGLKAIHALGRILDRAEAADERRKGAEINRPRDSDLIAAADRLLDRAYGKSAPDRSPPGFVGSYDLDKLTNEQLHTVTSILKLAAPEGAVGDTD